MITLHNDQLTVVISEKGAELQSICAADGYEYLWQGDPAVWGRRAPVLFPICGRLPDNEYIYEGNSYQMGGHGFARDTVFDVETVSDTAVTLKTQDSAATRAIYPFGFEFRVTVALEGRSVAVTYAVHNTEDTPLYASFGSHEGYRCPEGLGEYDLILPEPRTLDTYLVSAETGYITAETKRPFDNSAVLSLSYDWFAVDALVFKHPQLSQITLRNRRTGRGVTVAFEGAQNLLVWSKPDAPLICIEPWWGMGVCDGDGKEFAEKTDIHRVEDGQTFATTHTITVLS